MDPEQVEELSVADALRQARDELASDGSDEQAAEAAGEEAPQSPAPEDAAPGDASGDPDEAAAADGDDEEPEPLKAPQSWPAEAAAAFAELPRNLQETVLTRERDREAHLTRASQETAPLRRAIERHQDYLERIGAPPEVAFERLIAAEQALRFGTDAQRQAAFMRLAQDYGISLETRQANGKGAADGTDPEIAAAVQPLQSELDAIKASIARANEASEAARVGSFERLANDFLSAKSEAGDPAHPHADNEAVWSRMLALVTAEREAGTPMTRETLESAYDSACWAVPEVRNRILEDQRIAERREAAKRKQAEADKARKASSGLGGGSTAGAHSGTKDAPTGESVGDTLRKAMAEVATRAQG